MKLACGSNNSMEKHRPSEMDIGCPRAAVTTVQLSVATTPGHTHVVDITDTSAEKVSKLLTTNHRMFHTRWKGTFHNHMVHHLLALWSLGASPDQIQDMWDYNETYQTSREPGADESASTEEKDLADGAQFDECLGVNTRYADFLRFFEDEIAKKGVPATVKEYVLNGDTRANSILCRMLSDLEHPFIHLGCGIEFDQPSIVAEALAGGCVHETWPAKFLLPTEDYVRKHGKSIPSLSFLDMLASLYNDESVRSSVKHTDPFNKIADGLLMRLSSDQLARHLGQFRVERHDEESLRSKLTDLMYSCAYMIGAAQQPGKREAIDFVTLHAATMCVHYPAILAQDWLSTSDKARLIEVKARVDAVMYAGTGSPQLHRDRVVGYVPRYPEDGWPQLFQRAIVYRDEGHAAKLMRALFATERLAGEPDPDFPIRRADLLKIGHMAMDSVEVAFDKDKGNKLPPGLEQATMQRIGSGGEMVVNNMTRWVFYGGLENAWCHVPNLDRNL